MQNLQYLDIDKNVENQISIISNGMYGGGICYNCKNLIKTPVCGPNVDRMSFAYYGCTNLTTAVSGNNVTNMCHAFYDCTKLTTAVCGPSVKDIGHAYNGCPNIQGNCYFYSNNITHVVGCFSRRNTSKMLNIYVQENSKTMNNCLISNTWSLTGSAITWTNDSANKRYYNASANIYIYPVANVHQTKINNGD